MARPASRHPTELELEILKILWRDGPASVRHVRDTLASSRTLAYTSVMTIMNIMTKKCYLQRTKAGGSFVYRPKISAADTTRGMLKDLVDRVFDGSAVAAMVNLLETSDIHAEELARLRQMISRKAKEQTDEPSDRA